MEQKALSMNGEGVFLCEGLCDDVRDPFEAAAFEDGGSALSGEGLYFGFVGTCVQEVLGHAADVVNFAAESVGEVLCESFACGNSADNGKAAVNHGFTESDPEALPP